MPFVATERKKLLTVKGVGPTVVARLEQMGYESFTVLAKANVLDILNMGANASGSSCWKNSPQAKKAIQGAIELAKSESLC